MPSKLCPQCGTEYDLAQQFCPSDGAALLAPSGESDFTGRIFGGRYRLIEKLGAGGMGSVYRAEHVRLRKPAAVKVIRKSMTTDAAAIARFNREAQNASLVNHPNVAAVFDFGEADDGVVFLAMEYVDGEPLSDIIARGPLEPARAARIVTQIADALAAAHRTGVVHRDLKPDNVMIARAPDGSDLVKLVDFGISKVANTGDQNITATGMVIGTPTYMSPEQAKGTALDSRSDIYSLGVLTFQALTAALPFKGDTPQEQMVSRLIESPATLSAVRPDIAWAPAVEHVLSKALASRPEDRYDTAQEFARALETALRLTRRTAGLTPTIALGAVSIEQAQATGQRPNAGAGPAVAERSASGATAARAGAVAETRRGSRWPLALGVIAAVVVVGVAAMLVLQRRAAAPSSADPSAAVARDAAAAVEAVATSADPEAESTPRVQPQGQPVERRAAATSPVNASPPAPAPRPIDFNTAVQRLAMEVRAPGAVPATYRRAYAQSVVLLKHSRSTADSVRVLFYQSRALVLMGDRADACRSLSQAIALAGGAPAARGLERVAQRLRCE